jgi:hypothetical protein
VFANSTNHHIKVIFYYYVYFDGNQKANMLEVVKRAKRHQDVIKTVLNQMIDLIDFCCLIPLSAILQLYHSDQF